MIRLLRARTLDVQRHDQRRGGTVGDTGMSRAAFLRRAAALGLLASAGTALGAAGPADAARTARPVGSGRRGLTYRGMSYDVGTDHFGESSRPVWSSRL